MIENLDCNKLSLCLCCDSDKLKLILDLKSQPLANSYVNDKNSLEEYFPLALNYCSNCTHLQLTHAVNPDLLFKHYLYVSGTTKTLRDYFDYFVGITEKYFEKKQLTVLDIACNDGTLLSFVPENIIRVGIDPVDDSYKKESEKNSNLIIQDYFSHNVFSKSKYGDLKAKVITTIAMFYDLEDPKKFVKDIVKTLDDDGLWVLQMSYTPLMISQLAFDNICHEHVYYYSLFNIKKMFKECGIEIIDAQLNDTNGGSFRLYCMKEISDKTKFGTQPYRDVCNFRVNSILEYEKTLDLGSEKTWVNFFNEINTLREKTLSFIKKEKNKGKKIWAYGASTKGNTLLQYFNLDNNLIDGIAERSPYKYGLKTVGTNIPIYSEEDMRKEKPDYLLVLPWHFINEFVERETEFLKNGGKFIVPCPKFEIIGL
jgi:2-polyprenyl-3-methyl-5-hydroxy-6-metoxy-1,4-benzoquinol methylase